MTTPAITDHLPIALRAFAAPQFADLTDAAEQKPKRKASTVPPSEWALIDTGEAKISPMQIRSWRRMRVPLWHRLTKIAS